MLMWPSAALFIFLVVFHFHIYGTQGQLPEHYPKFLKTKYGDAFNPVKLSVPSGNTKNVKTFRSSYVKTGGSSNANMMSRSDSSGCGQQPIAPMNSMLRCSQYSGCRATCNAGYSFPNGETELFLACKDNKWQVDGWPHIPPCQPVCSPVCENNGICYEPNKCNCPENFSGAQCQFEKRPCLNYPPLPMNARRTCSSTQCTITCLKGHQFPDGSAIANLLCKDGTWIPARGDLVTIPDCQATCNPSCENGGICLSLNMCQCPQDYRGPQCQYRIDACSAKRLNFNGGYNCSGDMNTFRCSIKCPESIEFEFTPSPVYSCRYDTGEFKPQPVPQCVFGDNVEIVSLGGNMKTHYGSGTHSETTWSSNKKNWKKGQAYNVSGESEQSWKKTSTGSAGNYITKLNNELSMRERRPARASCSTWGGSHYKTFDGAIFSASSTCAHILARDARDDTFSIVLQNSPWCYPGTNGSGPCHRMIDIYVQGKKYTLMNDFHKDADKYVPVLKRGKDILPIPSQLPGIRAIILPNQVQVALDSIGIMIKWDMKQLVQVQVSESLWNRTEGLCGLLNGDASDDLIPKSSLSNTPNNHKATIQTLVSSWKADSLQFECDMVPSEIHGCDARNIQPSVKETAHMFCTGLLAEQRFSACHELLDVNVLLEACKWDYCACAWKQEAKECACKTMDMYVKECRHKGVNTDAIINWRDENTCPMKCTGKRIYKACAAKNSNQPTCGSLSLDSSKTTNENEQCEEGCYCPDGLVLHDGKCIAQSDCPCQLRGKRFKSGTTVPKECNTCTCTNGHWKCTQISCGARCSAIGDPHYRTFDGRKFDFMGQCSYYLVKGKNFTVEAENVACAGSISQAMNFPMTVTSGMPSCTKALTIRTETGDVIKLKQNKEIIVNGRDIGELPYDIGDNGDVVRMASSMFVVVELESGMQVWWDGVTRAYIDVPASFRGQTNGLCGTFNANQNDDFLTPEGDIEQAVEPFANKWKTDERCPDVIPESKKSHPCDVNIHRKADAESHCSKIKSKTIFGKCHWLVDPEQYYRDCMYDMCSCETKASQCLCPTIAAYAKECANLGAAVTWRINVPICGIQCPFGQTYQACGDSCARSCRDLSVRPDCAKQCVEGCNCPPGQTLDEYGECISIGQCPCIHVGIEYPAGYKEIRTGTLAPQLCTCTNAVFNCKPARKDEISTYPKSDELKAMCNGVNNQEFTTCEPTVAITCRNMHQPHIAETSAAICHQGCKCKKGYVLLDAHNGEGKCVRAADCPCHHGGRSFNEGEKMQSDCNDCVCKEGKWICEEKKCPGVCYAWGDSHFNTFDGKVYDYQGQCDYVLAKGALGKHDNFEVTVQNVQCSTLGVSCSRALSITVGSETIKLTRGRPIPSHLTLKRLSLRQTDMYVIVEAADLGISVRWDKGTRVYVRVDPRWAGRMRGLCGNYNSNQMDDFQTPSGGFSEVSAKVFGDSWRLHQYCSEAQEIQDPCIQRPERKSWAQQKCGVLKSQLFAPCHTEVPVEEFHEKCVFDTCACDQGGDCECLCTALAAYAHECNARGVHIKWRSNELCPLQCDERCSQYTSCMSPCPLETCDNLLTISQLGRLCKEDSCVEGCAPKPCAEGMVFLNASSLDCVPRNTCKPICMEVDGVIYSEGDIMEEDECHKCYCTRTKKKCVGKPCTGITQPPLTDKPSQTEPFKCKSGWTEWINQDKIKGVSTKGKKVKGSKLQIEPLPTATVFDSILTGGKCSIENMRDIQCRTVEGHIDPKATGLDVECSIERGLVCKADATKRLPCPDFEIRVLCDCEHDEKPKYPPRQDEECDMSTPYKEYPNNCHMFYHCAPTIDGTEWVEKTCGPTMYFNPNLLICDWIDNVLQVRPNCSEMKDSKNITDPKPGTSEVLGDQETIKVCPIGFIYSNCLFECQRLCLYYNKVVLEDYKLCLTGKTCEPGCIPEDRLLSCPAGMFWRDNSTCVKPADCLCRAHDGSPVKPGTVYQESDCEICQCINNYYRCDRSACSSTTEQISISDHTEPTDEDKEPVVPPGTETPPEACDRNHMVMLADGPWPVSDAAFNASGIKSSSHQPWNARLSSRVTGKSAGSWAPNKDNKNQYIQLELNQVEPVYGVVIKGSPLVDSYVTSYRVMYSKDGRTWHYVTNPKDKQKTLFHGSVDQYSPVEEIFKTPFEAKIIRIKPQSWHNGINIRFDVFGCSDYEITTPGTTPGIFEAVTPSSEEEMQCDEPMGMEDGRLPENSQVSVSSGTGSIKLNSSNPWKPSTNNPNEWVVFDFSAPRNVTGMETKGGPQGWVKGYEIDYSHDKYHWNPIVDDYSNPKLFRGNIDQDTPHKSKFGRPIRAQYFKITPKKWTNNIQMRAEPIGCFEPYSITESLQITTTSSPFGECNYCPDLKPEVPTGGKPVCRCSSDLWWDGENCVARAQCPCVQGHIKYPVGNYFEKEDCTECLCALGGVAQCQPKECKKCEQPDHRPVMSATCSCVCKPCPENQVLCPTSEICINATSWCNGIIECPDDEVNCQSSTIETPVHKEESKVLDKQKCPEVVCPPGYRVKIKKPSRYEELHKNLSPMFYMYNGRRPAEFETKSYSKGGRKNSKPTHGAKGSKILGRNQAVQSQHSVKTKKKEQECVQFICVPDLLTPEDQTAAPCPEPKCPPGYTIIYQQDRLTEIQDMEMVCPQYECRPPPVQNAICNVTGRTFNTFDGTEFKYDICHHVLARDLINREWHISLVKNCSGTTCTKNLIIQHGDTQKLTIFDDLSFDFGIYHFTADQVTKIGQNTQDFHVSKLGESLLFISNHFKFFVLWDKQTNVKLGVTETSKEQVDGLCGFYDGNPKNDKRKPDGSPARTTVEFGDSWALDDNQEICKARTCPLHLQNKALTMCKAVKEKVLAPCHHINGDVDGWISKCLESACSCLENTAPLEAEGAGTEAASLAEEHCRCDVLEDFVVECRAAKPTVLLDDWRMQLECPASCPAPLVHQDCFKRRCEPSCSNLADSDACPVLPNLCFPGCYCPPGLVRKKDKCVPPRECRDCECNVLPHLEYVTFDGANHTANTNCTYVMAQDKVNQDGVEHDFQVFISNAPCPLNPLKMCSSVVTLVYDDHRIQVKRGNNQGDDHLVYIDDVELLQLPFDNGWIEVTRLPQRHINLLISKIQLELRAYYPTLGASLRVPSHSYGGKMEGICGDCNRNPSNDNLLPTGKPAKDSTTFIDAWQKDDSNAVCVQDHLQCEKVTDQNGNDPCLALLDTDRFGHCHMLLDPAIFLSTCRHDTCSGKPELACSSLETYAVGCRAQGLCIDWHTSLCPAQNCLSPTKYQLCGPPCARTCERPHGCRSGLPSEGCFCPEGLLLKNGTCVEERACYACDDQGHYPGDKWEPDACTSCVCDESTRTVRCESKQCPEVDKVCEDGYMAIKVKKMEGECCEKYACVPRGTVPPICEEPKPLNCAKDQIRKLEKRPNGCHEYVCECKPFDECDNVQESTSEPLPEGIERIINNSGCCPSVQLICKSERCSKPAPCQKYHHHEELPKAAEICCPEYKCVPPEDKCLINKKHTAADKGGERELSPLEQTLLAIDINATIEDGPCRTCRCVQSSAQSQPQSMCTGTHCVPISELPDVQDYVLEEEWVINQCCPNVKRAACKDHKGKEHEVGTKWPLPGDPCTELECTSDEDGDATKTKHVITCDKQCALGSKYIEPAKGSKECCGNCKQTECVVNGELKEVGSKWQSDDHCTEYKCLDNNGTIVVNALALTCPELSDEMKKEYIYETIPVPGECCGRHVQTACKVGEKVYQVGDAWPDPEGDPCVTVSCLHASAASGELSHQKTVQTCSDNCKPGWKYRIPTLDSGECCGECNQVACIFNETQMYEPDETWTSPDGCTNYECHQQEDKSLSVITNQETCPDTLGCPPSALYRDKCCTKCNMTALSMINLCEPVKMNGTETIGLVHETLAAHGYCYNTKPVYGLTECRGQCDSATIFNPQTSIHESRCHCCQATQYGSVLIELVCLDGHRFQKQIAVPTLCSCEGCSSSAPAVEQLNMIPNKSFTKTKLNFIKV